MSSPTGLERHPQVGRDRHHQRGRLLVDEAVAGPSFTRSEDQPVVTRRAAGRLSAAPSRGVLIEMGCSWTRVGRVVSERVLELAHRASRRDMVVIVARVTIASACWGRGESMDTKEVTAEDPGPKSLQGDPALPDPVPQVSVHPFRPHRSPRRAVPRQLTGLRQRGPQSRAEARGVFMGRPPLPVGTIGRIRFEVLGRHRVQAGAGSRDFDGRRKTVAPQLDEAGLSARQIADHLGHSRPSLTQDVYLGRGTTSPRTAAVIRRAL